jgi:alpha-mannosidase
MTTDQTTFAYIPSSHLDLYWLGNYKTCLERGSDVIKRYVDRCLSTPDETFLLETAVFAEYFLQKYPEYQARLVELVRQGRLELGAAYVDRWETLVPGESLIRNVQLGKRWYRQIFDAEPLTVTHPDLPSMIPQIAQIYSQLGLRYYVTSRKVYPNGQVWRYRAPDGSRMLVLNWPHHYIFSLISKQDLEGFTEEQLKHFWSSFIDLERTPQGFPLGTVPVPGSAGDLAGRENFVERYGQPLEEYMRGFRERYPQYRFEYSIPSRVLAPYESFANLPEHSGQIPSVWGVACDEEVRFFQRNREIENDLLAAETMAAAAQALGLAWRPESAGDWQGTFFEQTFYARKDPIPADTIFRELWRMHVFTQDHNGGGQEGALSIFQKRVIQDRLLQYTAEIHRTVLDQIAGALSASEERLLVFNPLGQPWQGPLTISLPAEQWTPGSQVLDETGKPLTTQTTAREDGQVSLTVDLPAIPAVGYRALAVTRTSAAPQAAGSTARLTRRPNDLKIETGSLSLEIDLTTGAICHLVDKASGQDWGGTQVGLAYALPEVGNDVTLRIAPDAKRVDETLLNVEVLDGGSPLFTRVVLHKQMLRCAMDQTLTIWNDRPRLDVETCIYWCGEHRQQVRLNLPSAPADRITHGSPFYGVGWADTVQGTAPYNQDEVTPEDQMTYREVHDWLHLDGERGGLSIVTDQPGFNLENDQLSAVLIRTSPSCGDGRLFFENAGKQVFNFSLIPGEVQDAARLAQSMLRLPLARLYPAQAQGTTGSLADQDSLLSLTGKGGEALKNILLSSLYLAEDGKDVLVRVWNTSGSNETVNLTGTLAQKVACLADLMDEPLSAASGQAGRWQIDVPGYSIRTVRFHSA